MSRALGEAARSGARVTGGGGGSKAEGRVHRCGSIGVGLPGGNTFSAREKGGFFCKGKVCGRSDRLFGEVAFS